MLKRNCSEIESKKEGIDNSILKIETKKENSNAEREKSTFF